MLKIKRYLSAYNEHCEVNVEGAYINMKLIIGIRESGTGNRELVPPSLYELMSDTFLNSLSVPGSSLTITSSRFLINYNWVYTSCCFFSISSTCKH